MWVDMEELGGCTGSNYATGFLGVGVGILLTRAWYAIAGCCQKKHKERIDQDACRDGELEELESWKKLKQVELKQLCALNGLAISGNKTELASRLIQCKPAASEASQQQTMPSAYQLKATSELAKRKKATV